jgi:hypothetical protein
MLRGQQVLQFPTWLKSLLGAMRERLIKSADTSIKTGDLQIVAKVDRHKDTWYVQLVPYPLIPNKDTLSELEEELVAQAHGDPVIRPLLEEVEQDSEEDQLTYSGGYEEQEDVMYGEDNDYGEDPPELDFDFPPYCLDVLGLINAFDKVHKLIFVGEGNTPATFTDEPLLFIRGDYAGNDVAVWLFALIPESERPDYVIYNNEKQYFDMLVSIPANTWPMVYDPFK